MIFLKMFAPAFRFTVQLSCLPYLTALVYYLKQNLVHVPATTVGNLSSTLLLPNYSTGNTRRFRDIGLQEEQLSPQAVDSDIFLWNDYNEKGGRNGIAVLALSLVDGTGSVVKHVHHPRPSSSANSASLDLAAVSWIPSSDGCPLEIPSLSDTHNSHVRSPQGLTFR